MRIRSTTLIEPNFEIFASSRRTRLFSRRLNDCKLHDLGPQRARERLKLRLLWVSVRSDEDFCT